MDPIIEKIKDYVLVINPSINRNDFLDFVVRDVVDRVLIYTRRDQFVDKYEQDLVDSNTEPEDYVLPIPEQLKRPIASVIIATYKTINDQKAIDSGSTNQITGIKDNGQEITYSDKIATYNSSVSDEDILIGITSILDRYKVGEIIKNDYTSSVSGYCREEIL